MKIYRAAGGKRVIRWKVSRDGDRKEDDRKQGGNTAPRDKWLTIDEKEPS